MTWKHIWIMDQSYIDMRTKQPYHLEANLKVWSARLRFCFDDGALPLNKMRHRIETAIEKHGYKFMWIDNDKEIRVVFSEPE